MKRKVIYLKDVTFEMIKDLTDYVWTKDKLIPQEYFDSKECNNKKNCERI